MRGLWHSPLFTAITVATLSLGIGATTAIYSFVDAVLLSSLSNVRGHRGLAVRRLQPLE